MAERSSRSLEPIEKTAAKPRPGTAGRVAAAASRFWQDEEGIILPYVTVMITVIVGVGVLALDGARFESLQTQLQKGADSLALAGAAELNQLPNSITRATAAINHTGSTTLVSNSSFFGTGGSANVTVSSICFLSSLPAGATATLGTCLTNTTDNAVSARFVQVIVSPVSVNTVLPASFIGGANSMSTQAQAVAGNNTTVCGATPMFICNPFEAVGNTDYGAATQALVTGMSAAGADRVLHQLVGSNGAGSYAPGNFGYLQPSTGTLSGNATCGSGQGNSNSVVQAMALSTINICINQNAVTTQTGNDSNVYEAMDVRFDLWKANTGSFQSCKTDSNYAPDVNVRKGYLPKKTGSTYDACAKPGGASWPPTNWPPGTTGPSTTAGVGLPVDNNMLTSGVLNATLIGNGNWTCGDITSNTTAAATHASGATTVAFASTTGLWVGMALAGTGVASGATISSVTATTVSYTGNDTLSSGTAITFTGYWNTAHPSGATGNGHMPTGCSANPATTSRYSVYQYEIANSYSAHQSGSGEQGSGNMCSTTTPVAGRRALHLAVVNCQAELGNLNGHTTVPVAGYIKSFLALPVDGVVSAPYVEFNSLDTPGNGNGFLYQSVQLYR